MIEHPFTEVIRRALREQFGGSAEEVLQSSLLLQYLNLKTRSVNRGSKARSSFGSIYALYTLVEDYVQHGYPEAGDYAKYEGAKFSDLFKRQRQLPFGEKLQNHYFNNRLNGEFRKYFPTTDYVPIMLDAQSGRYWISENLLNVPVAGGQVNIAKAVIKIIDSYIEAKRDAFQRFADTCAQIQDMKEDQVEEALDFIKGLIQPEVDARIFEIVSYVVLKQSYAREAIYWGWKKEELKRQILMLYKTGRTNANDGGIDFVMQPLGRFFQVTETTDFKKYFLDIDKVHRYPITFVVKSTEDADSILRRVAEQATAQFGVEAVVAKYMEAVDEIINVPNLLARFEVVVQEGKLHDVLNELLLQVRVEFNIGSEAD